jgi:hypothetical protein
MKTSTLSLAQIGHAFRHALAVFVALLALPSWASSSAQPALSAPITVSASDARAIARDAYIWGFPLVDNYRVMHSYWVNPKSPEYKGAPNTLHNSAQVFGPQDKALQTPNSDTPYSSIWMDLRAEPMVLTLPAIDPKRYYSVQLVDSYTYNFDYLGTRVTGNKGGRFLIVGPGWKGKKPKGIARVIRAETEHVFALYRTQLFNPADIDKVRQIQTGYKAQPLSAYLGKKAPAAAPAINYITPLSAVEQKTSLEFFNILNAILRYCPPLADEKALLARFAQLNIGAGKQFAPESMSAETRQAITDGIADAWAELGKLQLEINTGKKGSGDMFGTRQFINGNYLYRMAGAVLGIYGNSRDEALYPIYFIDAQGKPLDTGKNNYTLRLAPDAMPPVNSFWSLTMYGLPERLLIENPLNRYLINSPMLPDLKRDADGGITIYVQNTSPGPDKDSNWLPAPAGPFFAVLRLYLPTKAAFDGSWKNPPLQRSDR